MMRVAVIGAGPAGMTAALQLCRGGADVAIFEAAPQVGGLARSLELWGQRVDLGPHRFFSTDARVNRLWLDVVGRQYAMVDRHTRIYFDHRFYDYPLRPLVAAWSMGPQAAVRCAGSYLAEQCWHTPHAAEEQSFETWMVDRFGRRLFEMFFKSYSEKLWGIPCNQLSADFAAQRIKQFSLPAALANAFWPNQSGRHRTLLDRFAYPLGGTGSVYETMAREVVARGGQLELRTPVRRVIVEEDIARGIERESGHVEEFDHVISTMPLTRLVEGLPRVPDAVRAASKALRFRNTIVVYLHMDRGNLFADQWLYIHSPELKIGRLTNFSNWVPEICQQQSTTILAAEIWCDSDDALWTLPDAELIDQVQRELRTTGLLGNAQVLEGHVERVAKCYPVYRVGYREHVDCVAKHLQGIQNLSVIGRYGAFKYNNQDHSILMGILAAENLLDGETHDLWSVNSDFDSYQEWAIITAEGLSDCTLQQSSPS